MSLSKVVQSLSFESELEHLARHRAVLIEELIKLLPDLRAVHLEPTLEVKKKVENLRKPSLNATAFLAPQFLPFR